MALAERETMPFPALETDASGAPLVLLFYHGYERYALPGVGGSLYSNGRRIARYAWRSLRRRQVHTGFYTAFLSLVRSLRAAGCNVRINDFAAARARPHYPIGLAGYPGVIEAVDLPNPVVFGHGDLGLPDRTVQIAGQERMRILIQPCQWAVDYNRPYCGDKLRIWPAGVDRYTGPQMALADKPVDFLIYDKIRWHRDQRVPQVLDRVTERLDKIGHSYRVLRYGGHIRSDYDKALKECRALLFLCEHETQGLAYQEAMAASVPVLAWDEGELVDPILRRFASPKLTVSSVPYFDERCGMTFRMDDFEDVLPLFWSRLGSFEPRAYMNERLSIERAANDYLALYSSLAVTG
jgi:glycosyltransferase involved in cell wall biosynthesis